MAFTPRSFLNVVKNAVGTLLPGVGKTLDSVVELVSPGKKPDLRDMQIAVSLVKEIRAIKPGINSTEFVVLIAADGTFGKILFDDSMPTGLRIAALIGIAVVTVGYMVSRGLQKKKTAEKV
ncbi:hypothetical protein LCGC14_0451320 [marine sediment metagenome]|uniref:Uncharacterized protein n=1 Tax=marine sediment metagenome TaxID=412755 RepID=A0A0F9V4P0_9ZZZZ